MRTAYKYRYNGKEQLSSFQGRYDYGFRMYDAGVARFLSVDPLTKKYPELTPYQFASNTPIQAIDLDGLEAFFVHGTWSDPSTYSKLSKQTITNITKNTEGATFQWSGNNTDIARQIAGKQLAEHVMKNRDGKQSLTIVGHSHGGNVAIIAANILKGKGYQVDNLITFNTPVREYQLDPGAAGKHFSVYHQNDPVQLNGGNSVSIPDGYSVSMSRYLLPLHIGVTSNSGSLQGTGEIGADMLFFETKDGFNFRSLQSMFKDNIYTTYKYQQQGIEDKTQSFQEKTISVLDYEFVKTFDMLNDIWNKLFFMLMRTIVIRTVSYNCF